VARRHRWGFPAARLHDTSAGRAIATRPCGGADASRMAGDATYRDAGGPRDALDDAGDAVGREAPADAAALRTWLAIRGDAHGALFRSVILLRRGRHGADRAQQDRPGRAPEGCASSPPTPVQRMRRCWAQMHCGRPSASAASRSVKTARRPLIYCMLIKHLSIVDCIKAQVGRQTLKHGVRLDGSRYSQLDAEIWPHTFMISRRRSPLSTPRRPSLRRRSTKRSRET
jgi:hypothetical protein